MGLCCPLPWQETGLRPAETLPLSKGSCWGWGLGWKQAQEGLGEPPKAVEGRGRKPESWEALPGLAQYRGHRGQLLSEGKGSVRPTSGPRVSQPQEPGRGSCWHQSPKSPVKLSAHVLLQPLLAWLASCP